MTVKVNIAAMKRHLRVSKLLRPPTDSVSRGFPLESALVPYSRNELIDGYTLAIMVYIILSM